MASSSANPNQPTSTHFDMHKLFKPPPNPNSNPAIPLPATVTTATTTTPASYPPSPSAPFPYPPQQFQHHHHYLHQQPLPPPSPASNPNSAQYHLPYNFPTLPHPNNPNSGAHIMALLGTPAVTGGGAVQTSHLDSTVSMPQPSSLHSVSSGEFLAPPVGLPILPTAPSAPPAILASAPQLGPARVASGKMPKGRHLSTGDQAVYDVDVRLSGETQPTQLEVTPITKYVSDPGLVLGRQIAVNRTYICYGLKLGAVRVLNINTALRSLLRGHNQRVSDMAFFAEDVHLLASASIDGRVFVWKINEGPDELEKPQITGKIVIAIQIVSNEESVHPRICWHCHKQEVLVVAIGNLVLKVDTTKVGRGETFSADEPLKCPVDKLIDGVQLVGKHDGDVTDLSMSQWMTTRLASASKDGMVKIWDDRKAMPLVTLRPHDGQPVNSVAFLTAPNHPDHIVLITAGPLNREVKIWASSSEAGWLLPSDSESWHCTQTLVLKSSAEPRVEEAFFNQVVVLPHASLMLLANAKKNAIYAVHVDYGPNPSSTRLDYITEFTVTMPILSLTGTTDCLPDGEQVVQVYCVQTQAIQQYALELTQCLPPPLDSGVLDKDASLSRSFATTTMDGFASPEYSPGITVSEMHTGTSSKSPVATTVCESASAVRYPILSTAGEVSSVNEATINLERKSSTHSSIDSDISRTSSRPVPTSPDVPGRSSGFRSPPKGYGQVTSVGDASFNEAAADPGERRGDGVDTGSTEVASRNDEREETKASLHDISAMQNTPNMYIMNTNATHLITPSEILSGAVTSYENSSVTRNQAGEARIQDIVTSNGAESAELEVKVVGENVPRLEEFGLRKDSSGLATENKERVFSSDGSETNLEMVKEYSALKTDITNEEESQPIEDIGVRESVEQPIIVNEEEVQEIMKDVPESTVESTKVTSVGQSPTTKWKKQKAKQSQALGPSSSSISPFNSTDSLNEQGSGTAVPFTDAAFSQILAMQESVNQLMAMQKEMQKQISVAVACPVTKEGKRVEASLGRSMEKAIKANVDALWARFQEENAKREKLERDRMQQVSNHITNCMSKDLPAMLEKALKKEFSSVGPAVARAITPVIEKTISSAVVDSVQRVVGDKALGQLEKSINSKLEATIARQIQAQFQTSGKQALQEALRSNLEASVVPAFEQSCKTMFEQVDVTFQKGMTEHTAAAQKQFESTHTPLVLTLRDAINSASSFTQNLTTELAEGQRKLLALVASGNQNPLNSMGMQQSADPLGGLPMVEAPVDPTKELSRLISDRKFDEAFTLALQRSDVSIVSWLCSQVDLQGICSMTPLPLSQGVLLALLQQLACDISKETPRKLGWMTDVAVVINPADPTIALHVRPIFEQIYQILIHQRSLPTTTPPETSSIRLILHVINSVLISCK